MPKKEYGWELGQRPPQIDPHTIVKHYIYQSYIEQYITTLNKNPRIPTFKLAVVDAFAGGRLYLDADGNEHQGSPIRIIDAIRNGEKSINLNRQNPIQINSKLFFIEKNKFAFKFLEKHLSNLGYKSTNNLEINPINSAFEKVYRDVVKQIVDSLGKNVRAIFILDQYGYVDAPFECIRDIFKCLPKSEVILTLAVNHLIDYIADPEKEVQKAAQINLFSQAEPSRKIESGHKVKNYLARVGLNIEELQENKQAKPKEFRGFVESKLLKELLLFSDASFYTPFFLGEVGYHRDIWLIHLSNHSEARSVMASIHWQHANNKKVVISHYGEHDLDMLGFLGDKNIVQNPDLFDESQNHFDFSNDAKHKMNSAIQDDLPQRLHGKEVTFKDFYETFANHTLASKSQLMELAKIALQSKEIEIIGAKGQKRRSKIESNDIISSPKQAYIDFKKKK